MSVWIIVVAFLGIVALGGLASLIGVIVAISKKRASIALATIGVVLLLGVGGMFGSLLLWKSSAYHTVQFSDSEPFAQLVPHDVSISATQFGELPKNFLSTPQHRGWNFNMGLSFVELVILGMLAAGIALAVASRPKHQTREHRRRTWWPALLLVTLIAIPTLLGLFIVRTSVWSMPSAHIESFHQDFGPDFHVGRQRRFVEQTRREAQQQLAEAQHEVMRAQQQIAEHTGANSSRNEDAKRIAEHATQDAVNALLRMHFATTDINTLIEMFQAQKIELSPATDDAEAPPAPPESPIAPPNAVPPIAVVAVAATAEPEAKIVAAEAESFEEFTRAPTAADEKSDDIATENGPKKSDNHVARAIVEDAAVEKTDSDDMAESKALPEWVNDPPKRVGDARREVVATDEYVTVDECYEARDIYLLLKTYERIQQLAGLPYHRTPLPSLYHGDYVVHGDTEVERHGDFDPGQWQFEHSSESVWIDPRLRTLQAMGIGVDYVQREIAKEEHIETNDRSFGPMKKLYTLIEFSPTVDRELRARWTIHEREKRLATVGAGAGSVLGLLGLIFGLLKIDTWTKGYYSKRLFIGVPAAIIGVMFALIVWNEIIF